MSLPEFSVRKPVTVLMFSAAVILLGVISWSRLSQELFPPITYPQITIVTTYENAAPEEVEALITRLIEESVSAAANIRKVSSTSREGTSIVICEFNWNTNMDFAALNVREKVDLIKERLPRDAEEPIVMKYNPFDTPILILSVTSKGNAYSPYELREISRRVIKDELEKIDGVAQVNMTGGREREIVVELNQDKLRAFNVSIMDIIELLKQENLNYPAGTIETSFYEYLVRTIGEFKTVDEMYSVPFLVRDKEEEQEVQQRPQEATIEKQERSRRVIYIRDLGVVKDTLKKRTSISRYNGVDNVSLSIQKQADANTLAVNKQIYEKLKILRRALPEEIKMEVVYDQSIFISQSINELRDNALQGGALAFIILLIFLRNLRSAIVVTFGIPISILFTLILMYFGKLSLNMMSLGGLALGVGMLVDNGIVVIENIYRHRQMNKGPKQAAEDAANEVFSAIIGSTLTTVAVFLPLVFVVGIAGQLFKQLALTVTFSLIASVITAMTLTPMFMSRGRAGKIATVTDEEKLIAEQKEKSANRYRGPFPYIVVLSIIVGTLMIALFSFKVLMSLDREFLPKLDQRQFMIKVNMPAGTNLETTDKAVSAIERVLLSFKVIKDVTVNIGSDKESTKAGTIEVLGSNQANIIVNLHRRPAKGIAMLFELDKKEVHPEYDISTSDLVQKVKDQLEIDDLKAAKLEYVLQESVFKSAFAGSAPLVIAIKGYELDTIMLPAAEEIEKQLKKIKGVYGIQNSVSPPSPEVKINVRKDRASLYQLSVNQIAAVAQAGLRGYVATKYKEEGKEVDVRVKLREQDSADFNKVSRLMIFSPIGMTVYLDQVAYLARGLGPTEIKREGKQRVIFVTANIYGRSLNEVVVDVKKILAKIREQLPQNYSVEIGGENKEMEESFKSLQFALVLALLLVYMIMASEFESLIQPFIIMFTVPLSLIGVSWALYFSKTPLSVVVVLGFIMLGGIVVNNGILLIDFINLARSRGLGIFEAAIQASKVRARPILMTSLTTIFGLLPLAFALGEGAELRAPMARTVMGGLASAAFLTLFVVPSIYIILESIKESIKKLFSSEQKESPLYIAGRKMRIEELEVSSPEKAPEAPEPEIPAAPAKPDIPESLEERPSESEDILDLTQRQMEALDYIRTNGKISRLEYVVKFKVPLPVADKELEEMVRRKIITASGEGPHKIYIIREKKED